MSAAVKCLLALVMCVTTAVTGWLLRLCYAINTTTFFIFTSRKIARDSSGYLLNSPSTRSLDKTYNYSYLYLGILFYFMIFFPPPPRKQLR